jgi:sec-independent protein translocase protein TatB
MDFLGIGPLELIFVILIALIIFGPKDMIKAGKTAGKYLRRMVKSPGWQTFQQASKEMRNLPTKLMREAGMDELEKDINTIRDTTKVEMDGLGKSAEIDGLGKNDISSWLTPPDPASSKTDEDSSSSETTSPSEKEQG